MPDTRFGDALVVSATELKQNFGKYMDYVEQQDDDVVITKNGSKVARLTPYVTDIERYFTVRENALDYQYGGKKVSYEEFMVIYEQSTLRMEFINGEIHLLDSPLVTHQDILTRLYLYFHTCFAGKACRVFFAPFDVHFFKKDLEEPDVMQPDLLVTCDLEGNISAKGKYMGTPSLVLEILSAGTRKKDMIDKLNTYTLSGVKEYWIVDPKTEKIILYTFVDCEIDNVYAFDRTDTASSVVFPGLTVDCGQLFHNLL